MIATMSFYRPALQYWNDLEANRRVEERLASANSRDYDSTTPPIPVLIGEKVVFQDYLKRINTGEKVTVTFVVGPAGAGKSVMRRTFTTEFMRGEFSSGQPMKLRLTSYEAGKPLKDDYYANDAKFADLSKTLDEGDPRIQDWIARELYAEWGADLTLPQIKKTLNKKAQAGLALVIDDFDEIHRNSREKLLTKLRRSIASGSIEKGHVVVLSRADALINQPGLDKLYELANTSGEDFVVNVAQIMPFSEGMNPTAFREYLADANKWGAQDDPERARRNFEELKVREPALVAEYTSWLDGANFLFGILENKKYEDPRLLRDHMAKLWYERAQEIHGFPTPGEDQTFREKAKLLLPEIAAGVEFGIRYKSLLFTGLIEIVPVDVNRGIMTVKPQFPSFVAVYAHPGA